MPRTKTLSDEEVLDASKRILLKRGPHDFTLADVAKEVGLSPATLVQRFGTKRGLLVAFARRSAERAGEPFESARNKAKSDEPFGLESLRATLVSLARDFGSRTELANSMALLLEGVRDKDLRSGARGHAEATEAAIAQHVRHAQSRGEIVPGDATKLARGLQAAWNGAVIQWALRGSGPIEDWVGETIDTFLGLASTRKKTRRKAAGRDTASSRTARGRL